MIIQDPSCRRDDLSFRRRRNLKRMIIQDPSCRRDDKLAIF